MTGLFKSHLQVIPSSLVFTASSVRGVIIIISSEDNYHHYCQQDKTQLICHELIIKSMSICVRWTMSPLFLLLVPSSRAVLATYVYVVTTDCSLMPIHCKPTCNNVLPSHPRWKHSPIRLSSCRVLPPTHVPVSCVPPATAQVHR